MNLYLVTHVNYFKLVNTCYYTIMFIDIFYYIIYIAAYGSNAVYP